MASTGGIQQVMTGFELASDFTRLFKQALGCGVASWIHGRRVERAVHMLQHTTRPIKAIAAEIGPDLHAFNKIIHRAFGVSPRAIRHATHAIRQKQRLVRTVNSPAACRRGA